MTLKNVTYANRDDDEDLNDILNTMKNSHIIFENCDFTWVSTKAFHNCQFINCNFENVTNSTFNNCTFNSPKFYDGFRGTFYNCNISSYYGRVGERKEEKKL